MQNDMGQWWRDQLGETELGRQGLFGSLFGQQRTPQRNYLQGLFPGFQTQYYGNAAQQLQKDVKPTSFSDWLQQNFNAESELLRAPNYASGQGTSRLFGAPRYLFHF